MAMISATNDAGGTVAKYLGAGITDWLGARLPSTKYVGKISVMHGSYITIDLERAVSLMWDPSPPPFRSCSYTFPVVSALLFPLFTHSFGCVFYFLCFT